MALLEYANLGYGGPAARAVLSQVFRGLKDFYEFQKRALDYLKQEKVFRAAWKPGVAPEESNCRRARGRHGQVPGFWVELVEPSGDVEDPDALFDQFFDEDNADLYEVPTPPELESGPKRRPARPPRANCLRVLRGHRESNQLQLDREPDHPHLLLWPNTRPLERQLDAIKQIADSPRPHQKPLVQLFERADAVTWPSFSPARIHEQDWFILRDPSRPGTTSQREFVSKALATPDFAVLEGPPGSGKTTAICELILQLVRQTPRPGRVLLCASTHVAVDTVLERLKDPSEPYAKWINPLRVGDGFKAKPEVRHYLPEQRLHSDTKRLKEFLRSKPASPARDHLAQSLDDDAVLQRLMLETSNVVCGTTIGILRLAHLLGNCGGRPQPGAWSADLFDVLIVDEASKTPFQEFLVPALMAKRWVLVGDPRQLSPFVDEDAMTVNLEACLPNSVQRNACADVFLARPDSQPLTRRRHMLGTQRPTLVVSDDQQERSWYEHQARERGVPCEMLEHADTFQLAAAGIILATTSEVKEHVHKLPLDICGVRGDDATPADMRSRVLAWRRTTRRDRDHDPSWANQYGFRLVREYEQRFRVGGDLDDSGETPTQRVLRLREEQDGLQPAFLDDEQRARLLDEIGRVRRVALPSILEAMQYGFAPDRASVQTALTQGLPTYRFAERHVLLEFQHRMHPEIAAFPSARVYGGRALQTDPSMFSRRAWGYEPSKPRARWLHISGPCQGRQSKEEADAVLLECSRFIAWAKANPRMGGDGLPDGKPWEIAVLTFYRAQERLLRDRLRQRTGQSHANHLFVIGDPARPACAIKLYTVDRFQGQEADVVLLSIANDHSTVFLESLNRLNVAITRARYLLIVIGNRQAMRQRRAQGTLLHELAQSPLIKTEDHLKERPDANQD
jgi:hypothetical protein